ncbi:MAG: ABC transporter ATP-binding protein [Erysipelotrichaceae bacterium]|nr:ABC transporter ATP-binding protein [Erysipelotrichaceae bacterium]
MKDAIEIKNLRKSYPGFTLGEISLNIPQGIIVGLIGENGAGKTTLIKTILNVVNKDNGNICVMGKDVESVKEEIGIVLDNSFFPEILNPGNIDSILKDVYGNWDSELFNRYLDSFSIKRDQILKTMSKGMRKKVEIATALSHHPKLLILDEPTSGLDPIVRNEVLDLFLDFIQDEEHTILLSTHITSDLEHIADQIVFIDKGKLILNKERNEIFDNYGIMRCGEEDFNKVEKRDMLAFKRNRYEYDVLVNDVTVCRKKYENCIIDKITLEDLMLIMVKGEKTNAGND